MNIEETMVVPLRVDHHGVIRIGKTRVTLSVMMHAYKRGDTPAEIVEAFTTLNLADVYAVIAYYLRHQEDMDEYLREIDAQEDAIIQEIRARMDPNLRERLLARRAQKGD